MNSETLVEPLLSHTTTLSSASVEPPSKPDRAAVVFGVGAIFQLRGKPSEYTFKFPASRTMVSS